jgi:hypothetical protein
MPIASVVRCSHKKKEKNMIYDISLNAILISLLAIASGVLGVLLKRQTEKLKIVEQQLSQSKYKAYSELVNIFYDVLKNTKQEKETDKIELMTRMIDSKKDLFIYGSDDIFRKFTQWLTYTTMNPDDTKHFKIFLDVLLLIRKDMGNKKTKLTYNDLLLSLTQNENDLIRFKEILE